MNDKPKKKPKKRWRVVVRRMIVTVLALVILAGAGWYGVDMLKREYTVTYDAYTATVGSISNALSFSGSLQLVNSKTYAAAAQATVRTVYVAEGDTVEKGDKLLRLSNGETMTADFDGRVNQVYVAVGDEVDMNTSLVQLADFTHMKVSLRVDEYDIADVAVGDACTVTATATEKRFQSSIASINYISASGGNVAYYTATAYVDVDAGVYPGMQVTVSIPQEEAQNVVILKEDALSFSGTNSAFVYMQDDAGEMLEVPVEVGVSNGNYVEIKSGVRDGDTVYVVAETTQSQSGLSSLMSGLFGGTQMNMPSGGMGGFGNSNGGRQNREGGSGSWQNREGGGTGGAPGRN